MVRKRRIGATLGLVAACTLVLILLGVAFFFLTKFLGGGREMANATDAGALNVAKNALRNPSQSAFAFSNPDVGTNFAGLGESPDKLNLVTYNRLVAQSIIVALNAKDEGTSQAGSNARKVWQALNDVARYLRTNHESQAAMGGYFTDLAQANNIKMLGNNGIGLTDYAVSYMKRGESTNVYIDPAILSTFSSAPQVPTNTSGMTGPSGNKYMSGYQPFSVAVGGETLTFLGVPVCPNQRAHLVSLSDFQNDISDDFAETNGYPPDILPPNSFKTGSQTRESKTNVLTGAVATAIVGSLDRQYQMQIPYGYLEIRNGPTGPGPSGPRATKPDDIFAYELFEGIRAQGTAGNNVFTTDQVLYDQWKEYNTGWVDTPGPNGTTIRTNPNSRPPEDTGAFRRVDGNPVTVADLESITSYGIWCIYSNYTDPMEGWTECNIPLLDAFRLGYNRPGSTDSGNVASTGFTSVEQYKTDLLVARVNIRTCAYVTPRAQPTGVKWMPDHDSMYAAPDPYPYNFQEVRSPLEYLEMIDQVSGGCGQGAILTGIVKRCQQILPSVSAAQVKTILRSTPLKLGQTLYIYMSGSALTMSESPPAWRVPGTNPDGMASPCGESFPLAGMVDVRQDGGFGFHPFVGRDYGSCKDVANWTPSSGYKNLLGVLDFSSTCAAGSEGRFCKPN